MKLYLSSYRLGYEAEKLEKLLKPVNGLKKVAFVANALDSEANYIRVLHSTNRDVTDLEEVGITVERLDLKDYFGKTAKLKKKLKEFSGVYVRGGNVFVLNQAYINSGFDKIILDYAKSNENFVYAAYSAGVCILTKTLDGLDIVDDIKKHPSDYPKAFPKAKLLKGLGLIDFSIAPHFRSDHPESQAINKTIQYFMDEKMMFIALRDGEVLIADTKEPKKYEVLKTTGDEKSFETY